LFAAALNITGGGYFRGEYETVFYRPFFLRGYTVRFFADNRSVLK